MSVDISQLLQLPVAERLEIIEQLWNSIDSDEQSIPVPDWHLEELQRREEEHRENPGAVLSWEEVQERLRKQDA